ncbi:MEGF10_11 [Mytilus coruscus]|uniref:MEGF10_11 n=1 Tax=Mytilus coruscus TaxID=42192 RepID=A0A6J8AJ43_MYTCO|nr:MEGF10_11 [Mytilus coruscus]
MEKRYKFIAKNVVFLICVYVDTINCTPLNLTDPNVCPRRVAIRSHSVNETKLIIECCPDYVNQNGKCQACPAGKYWQDCLLPCMSNYHGVQCKKQCNCAYYQICDPVHGCVCNTGYTGSECSNACPSGRYGMNCSEECFCEHEAKCDTVTGDCLCSAGWLGDHCTSACPAGTYGLNCKDECFCAHDAECDPVTGGCLCTARWYGDHCTKDVEQFDGLTGECIQCNLESEKGECTSHKGKCIYRSKATCIGKRINFEQSGTRVVTGEAYKMTKIMNMLILKKKRRYQRKLSNDSQSIRGGDLIRMNVRGYGHRFYRFVSLFLYGIENHHNKIRQETVKYMKGHKDTFLPLIDENFDLHMVHQSMTDGTIELWATEAEITAVSEMKEHLVRYLHRRGKGRWFQTAQVINLTKKEENSLKDILKDDNIVIRPADKGSGIIVIDKEEYFEKLEEEITNYDTYSKTEGTRLMKLQKKVKLLVNRMNKKGSISGEMKTYLISKYPHPAKFKGNSKIHNQNKPYRTIVNGIGTATKRRVEIAKKE